MAKRIADIAKTRPKVLNLSRDNFRRIPLTLSLKVGVLAVVFAFFLGKVLAPPNFNSEVLAQEEERQINSDAENREKRAALENELSVLERQIEEHQKTIEGYQKQGKNLKGEISALNSKISKLNLQIKAVSLNLTQLNQNIKETQNKITFNEDRIGEHKIALSRSLQAIHEADNQTLVEILLVNNRLSDFFANLNNISLVQNNLRLALTGIVKIREELVTQKEELSLQREDTENLKAIQEKQRREISNTQSEKTNLLNVTKGKESEYQKLLTKTKETAAQIRTRIFELLGGGELTFEKAYDYARLAEGATGVRAPLILSVLHRESLLGKNVGRCTYNAINPRTGKTNMNPTRDIPYFEDLLRRLNIDAASIVAQISCPNTHGTYGGAMGPAQFIPSTWKLYEGKIANITDNTPPSPWNNADAFAATAVYLKDLLESSGCKNYANSNKNVAPYQTLLERCAAAKYYAGGNWYTYRFWYGDPVVTQANKFEEDIKILKNSGV
ncbi:MAG: lytic murein transglycosylase [Patescibacteria group bacterium]